MEKLVGSIMGLSGNDGEVMDQLQKELSKHQEFLAKTPDVLVGLETLDFKAHSLGALHFLYGIDYQNSLTTDRFAIGNNPKHDKTVFIRKVSSFLVECTPKQVAIDSKKCVFASSSTANLPVAAVSKKFLQDCQDTKRPIAAVRPLRAAIDKIGPKYVTLSSHLTFQGLHHAPARLICSGLHSCQDLQSCCPCFGQVRLQNRSR